MPAGHQGNLEQDAEQVSINFAIGEILKKEKQKEIASLYATLMQEVKERLESVFYALDGGLDAFPAQFTKETLQLQIRIICENIALASLVAHSDYDDAVKLMKTWSATEIMTRLEKMNADFYPVPGSVVKLSAGRFHIEPDPTQGISKEEFYRIYDRAGDVLHKGSLKKASRIKYSREKKFSEIREMAEKIFTLVQLHFVLTSERSFALLSDFGGPRELVKVSIAEVSPQT